MAADTADPHAAVFAALVRQLQAHPALKGAVKVWRSPDGTPASNAPPSSGQLPWVRLSMVRLPSVPYTRTTHARPIRVQVEVAVAGKGPPASAAIADLAGRIEAALHGAPDPARLAATRRLRAALVAAGASEIVPEQPAEPDGQQAYGDALTTGTGNFRIDIYVKTR
jgi:hypothetical protein